MVWHDVGLTQSERVEQPVLGLYTNFVTLGTNTHSLPNDQASVLEIYNNDGLWQDFANTLNPETDAENDEPALFYQISLDGTKTTLPFFAVNNTRCAQMCTLWNACVTYEIWTHYPDGKYEETPVSNAMRCELWVYPKNKTLYAASPFDRGDPNKDHLFCEAASGQSWQALDFKPNVTWPPPQSR